MRSNIALPISLLSIDDDPSIISLITQELEEEGYRVVGATRAVEGIEKARLIGPTPSPWTS